MEWTGWTWLKVALSQELSGVFINQGILSIKDHSFVGKVSTVRHAEEGNTRQIQSSVSCYNIIGTNGGQKQHKKVNSTATISSFT